jgi:hypothetical protein
MPSLELSHLSAENMKQGRRGTFDAEPNCSKACQCSRFVDAGGLLEVEQRTKKNIMLD